MDIGKLDKRIIIQKYTSIESEWGNTINITIRYSRDLKDMDTRAYRVMWDNKIYNITHVDNPRFENKTLTLKCTEVME